MKVNLDTWKDREARRLQEKRIHILFELTKGLVFLLVVVVVIMLIKKHGGN